MIKQVLESACFLFYAVVRRGVSQEEGRAGKYMSGSFALPTIGMIRIV